MKNTSRIKYRSAAALFGLMILGVTAFKPSQEKSGKRSLSDTMLFDEIVKQDSLFFNAYNQCDLETQAKMIADNVEFYHDQGGLSTSKKEILEMTKKNICGKVTRELVSGTVEVYPIKDYGAVEIGQHRFHNNQEPEGTPSHASKFIVMWQQVGSEWQMTRVISLH